MPNPYTPPKTPVADRIADAGPRPIAVTIALLCIGLLVLAECYHQVMRLTDVNEGEISGLSWLVDWLWVVGVLVIGLLIARGRSWARWALAAYMLVQFYQLADAWLFLSGFESTEAMSYFLGPAAMWMLPTPSVLSLIAVILVFGSGRRWFQR